LRRIQSFSSSAGFTVFTLNFVDRTDGGGCIWKQPLPYVEFALGSTVAVRAVDKIAGAEVRMRGFDQGEHACDGEVWRRSFPGPAA
jgi:hypothetical protein